MSREDESVPEVTTVIHRRNCRGRHLTFGTHAQPPQVYSFSEVSEKAKNLSLFILYYVLLLLKTVCDIRYYPYDAMIKSAAQGKELLQSDIQRGELEGTRRPLLLLLLPIIIAAPLPPGPPRRGRGKDDVLNTVGFAGVNYYDPYWREQPSPGATDWIDARGSFQVGPEEDFVCELLRDLVDAFAVVEPNFAVEDVELEGD